MDGSSSPVQHLKRRKTAQCHVSSDGEAFDLLGPKRMQHNISQAEAGEAGTSRSMPHVGKIHSSADQTETLAKSVETGPATLTNLQRLTELESNQVFPNDEHPLFDILSRALPVGPTTQPGNTGKGGDILQEAQTWNLSLLEERDQLRSKPQPTSSSIQWSAFVKTQTSEDQDREFSQQPTRAATTIIDLSEDKGDDELLAASEPKVSQFTERTKGSATNTQSNAKGRKKDLESDDQPATDELNSDDIAVGLPKERYQPRPSRSRSTRVDFDDIDYSARPEKVAKERRKSEVSKSRTGTEDAAEQASKMPPAKSTKVTKGKLKRSKTADSATAEKLQSLRDMGFSPTRATIVLEQQSGNIGQTVEVLINNPVEAKPVTDNAAGPNSSHKESAQDSTPTPNEPKAGKKKGRGRPRSVITKTQESGAQKGNGIEDAPSMEHAEPPSDGRFEDCQLRRPLENLDTNQKSVKVQSAEEKPELHLKMGAPAAVEDSATPSQGAGPGEMPEDPVIASPGRHSPLNKGKVPYRVGLSRRARIAPLLKVVKK